MRSALLIMSLFCLSITAGAKVLHIGKDYPYEELQHAVNAAAAGDTILVHPGIYMFGNVIVEKSLTILGEGGPVLSGDNSYEILTIHANDVTIAGFRFRDTGIASINDIAAIKVLNSERLTIRDNQFQNCFFGIHISNSANVRILNNTLLSPARVEQQTGNGIHLWKCHHITVSGNDVRGHRDGIYFEFVTNSTIEDNHSEGNIRYGLHFMFSHNNAYRRNIFVRNGAGVAVMYTTGVTMTNNTFEHNWGAAAYGLLLKDIRDSEVSGNVFAKNSVGIFMEGSSRIRFTENVFSGNGYAIRLQASCDQNTFARNNFSANTFDLATNGTLVLNTLDGNYWDRYEGYDLNKDNVGDVPYRPVSMFSMVAEQIPTAILLWRSFLVFLVDRSEKAIPAITPENLRDDSPSMKPYDINKAG